MDWALNDAQTWTVIGVLAATLMSTVAFMATVFTRTLKSEVGGLRAEMRAGFGRVDARFEAVEARFEAVDARFEKVDARLDAVNTRIDGVNHRIDGLDRDVNLILGKVFGIDRDKP